MNVKSIPVDKKATPDELYSILNATYAKELLIYERIRIIFVAVFSFCFISNTYFFLSNSNSVNNTSEFITYSALSYLLSPIIVGLLIYAIIRSYFKPVKPTYQNAIDWHEFKDKVVYQVVPDENKNSDVVSIFSK